MERKHSRFAPSAAERWLNCPGSIKLSETAPPQFESRYALEGTFAHSVKEFLVKRFSNLSRAKEEALKKFAPKVRKHNFDVEEMVKHGARAAEIIYSLRPSADAKLLVEQRAVLSQVSTKLYGTLDDCWVEGWGTLTVLDYKYGAGHIVTPVDPETGEENPQLMIYAAALAYKFKYEFDRVVLGIIQPRAWNKDSDEDPLCQHTTTIKKIKSFEKRVAETVAIANGPNAPLNPGDWCKWCPALTTCPAVSKKQMVKADIVFDIDTGIEAAPDPKGLTAKTLPKVLDACDLLETWITGVREHAFRLAESGQKIAGRKLVPKRATRHWLPGAEKKMQKNFGNKAFRIEFLSPAQLEKVPGLDVEAFVKKYTTEVSTGMNLVKEDATPIAFDLDSEKGKA